MTCKLCKLKFQDGVANFNIHSYLNHRVIEPNPYYKDCTPSFFTAYVAAKAAALAAAPAPPA